MIKSNIETISEMSGYSTATVSNALNGKKGVSRETAEKIRRIAREIGYMKDQKVENIRLVIHKKHGYIVSETAFFSALIEGIEAESRAQGYPLLITTLNQNREDFSELQKNILEPPYSAIVLLATELNEKDIAVYNGCQAPLVILDAWFSEATHNTVLINNIDSVRRAVLYLNRRGHTQIGYLKSSIDIQNFKERYQGYRNALDTVGLTLNPAHTFRLMPTTDGAYGDMMNHLKSRPGLPTAFFADNDIIALSAMRALSDCGYRIPEDVSIIGFDDIPYDEIATPKLSTIRVYKEEIGGLAVRQLIDTIKRPDIAQRKVEVGTSFVERESVRTI